jgi:hypothetical protein
MATYIRQEIPNARNPCGSLSRSPCDRWLLTGGEDVCGAPIGQLGELLLYLLAQKVSHYTARGNRQKVSCFVSRKESPWPCYYFRSRRMGSLWRFNEV